jgi:hypothetical protein
LWIRDAPTIYQNTSFAKTCFRIASDWKGWRPHETLDGNGLV